MSRTASFISGSGILLLTVSVYYQGVIDIWESKKYSKILIIIS